MSNTPYSGRLGHLLNPLKRARTPGLHDDGSMAGESIAEKELNPIQERRQRQMRDLYARSERVIEESLKRRQQVVSAQTIAQPVAQQAETNDNPARVRATPQSKKRAAREIAEDDYDDEEDEEDENTAVKVPSGPVVRPAEVAPAEQVSASGTTTIKNGLASLTRSASKDSANNPEEARKKLEAEKKATESAAKESFLTTIYTVENDREAMLEQQKLDELDRQVETETSGVGGLQGGASQAQSSLSHTALGSAQLLMPNLVARLDAFRNRVTASDARIRSLLSSARIGGGKWANPDKVGQEELYESLEQVLGNLKGQVQHSGPFLTSVKKKDHPDYHRFITRPMDIGTMLKKLNTKVYRSKKEFTDDLDLIWANCLKYNSLEGHPLRKKAEHMRREAAKLTPLIPDITVRDRSEVEAEEREERRRQFDDSDDDDAPIAATRGRKAPNKGAKGGSAARKAPPVVTEDSPAPESKPSTEAQQNGGNMDSTMDGSQTGLGTPPVRNNTPLGALDGGAASHADISELESVNANDAGGLDQVEDPAEEDEEYKVWKQVTMKDRARMAAERNRLFVQNRISAEEPALMRSRAGMSRWLRHQRKLLDPDATSDLVSVRDQVDSADTTQTNTLAEGMSVADDSALPDYYYPLSGVPSVDKRLKWVEDADGRLKEQRDESLRLLPPSYFSSACTGKESPSERERLRSKGSLAFKIDSNIAQLQETRKIMAKIGMVKQMQVQTQTYQNQFQKYEPQRCVEAEIDPMPVSDEGPYIQPTVSNAALQRSIGKIFYHAGFEDYQPSALDAATQIATDFMQRMTTTLLAYTQHPKVNPSVPESFIDPSVASNPAASPVPIINEWQPRFTPEEAILHTLQRNGHELGSLTTYAEDEVPRLGQKLAAQHEATKQHYTDLLRPAMDPAVAAKDGGVGAFEDGSEQFLGGDFAEELDEDFFGFKSLGLDLDFKAVPLHLLQSRINSRYQPAAGATAGTENDVIMSDPPRWAGITSDNIEDEIGLVQDFFREKLNKTGGATLTEDEDLPAKQRFPKPRLPPTGKISSPRKRPIREQQMMARKKRRLEIEAERERERQEQEGTNGGSANMNEDGQGGGTATVAGTSAVDKVEMSGALTADATGTATAEAGTEINSEETSRRDSVAQPAVNGASNVPNGVLTNGDVNFDRPEQQTPTLSKQLKLEKPKEDQPPDTDPEKRSSLPIAAH